MSDIKYSSMPAFNASDDQTSRLQAGVALALNPVLSALSSSQMVLMQTPGFAAVGAAAIGARVLNANGGPGNVGAYAAVGAGGPNASLELHGDGSPNSQVFIDFASSATADYDWRLTETPDNNLQLFQSAASLASNRSFFIGAPTQTSGLVVRGTFSAPVASFRQSFFGGTFSNTFAGGASQYLQYLFPGGTTSTNADIPMPYAGSIVAISGKIAPGSGAGLPVQVFVDINGNLSGISTGIFTTGAAGTNTFKAVSAAKGVAPFVVGDILTMRFLNASGTTAAFFGEFTFWVETAP